MQELEKKQEGLRFLETFLATVVKNLHNYHRDTLVWRDAVDRLHDHYLPTLAYGLENIWDTVKPDAENDEWQEDLLLRFGALYLLIRRMQQWDSLDAEQKANLARSLGDPILDIAEQITDEWHVLAIKEEVAPQSVKVFRAWFRGVNCEQVVTYEEIYAQTPKTTLRPGQKFTATLNILVGSEPYVHSIDELEDVGEIVQAPYTEPSLETAISDYNADLKRNPLIRQKLIVVRGIIAYSNELKRWGIFDEEGFYLELDPGYHYEWTSLAMSEGNYHPLMIQFSGGDKGYPVAAYIAGRYIDFSLLGQI